MKMAAVAATRVPDECNVVQRRVQTSFGEMALFSRSVPTTYATPTSGTSNHHEPTLRVFMVHGNGFCKELWLPMVDDVAERLRSSGSRLAAGATRIDFIGLDLPNHGDSQAIPFPLDWWKFGKVVLEVVHTLGYRQRQHKQDTFIGLGHSLGGATLLMAQVLEPGTFDKLLVIEPMIFPPPAYQTETSPGFLEKTARRFNAFVSPEAAREYFSSRAFYRTWTPRVMEAFVQHGLRRDSSGVLKLKCDPASESEIFRIGSNHNLHERLGEVAVPTRLLYGADSTQYRDLGPLILPVFDQAVTTFRKVEGTTHSLPMERPDLVADELLLMVEQQKAKL